MYNIYLYTWVAVFVHILICFKASESVFVVVVDGVDFPPVGARITKTRNMARSHAHKILQAYSHTCIIFLLLSLR